MLFNQLILEEKERVEKTIQQLKKTLKKSSGLLLYAKKNRRIFEYYVKKRSDTNYQYISKKDARIRALARETYAHKLLKDLEEELRAINAYISVYHAHKQLPEHMLQRKSDAMLHHSAFAPFLYPEEIADLMEWQNQPYDKNENHPEGLQYRVNDWLVVRSKSEALIATALIAEHIPFHYEEIINLSGRRLAPDFSIRHPRTRQLILWEHFGMMDSPEYVRSAIKKLLIYIENGFIPDFNLILTFESATHPLDYTLVTKKIEHLLKQ